MCKKTAASQTGYDYQAMVFWEYANEMLCKDSGIEWIGYEYDEVKSFDDVVVKYKVPQVYKDVEIDTDYIQVKYHVDKRDVITLESLFEPRAIGATKYSFMEKVLKEYKKNPVDFSRSRFILYTLWDISQTDPLYSLLENKWDGIQLGVLFDGTKTDDSFYGKIRKKFRDELEVEDKELKVILKQIVIKSNRESIDDLKKILNEGFHKNNLKQWDGSQRKAMHLDVVQNYMKDGIVRFSKQELREICIKEELIDIKKWKDVLAIQSYPDRYEILKGRTDAVLNLMPLVEGRSLKENYTWKEIDDKIVDFIKNYVEEDKEYCVELLTSYSVIFMAGMNMRSITGNKFIPVQRTIDGKFYWDFKDESNLVEERFERKPSEDEIKEKNFSGDVAVVISATHDILESVTGYIKSNRKDISRIYEYKLPKLGFLSVKSGYHAWKLASQISSDLDALYASGKVGCIHIFSSCPMSLIFNLGKMSATYGKIQFYEFDKDRRTYDLGVRYPLE